MAMDLSALENMKCGTDTFSDLCVGATVKMNDEGFRQITSDIVELVSFLMTAAVQAAAGSGELTTNLMKAINSGKCAITSGANNFYNVLGAIYWLAVELK